MKKYRFRRQYASVHKETPSPSLRHYALRSQTDALILNHNLNLNLKLENFKIDDTNLNLNLNLNLKTSN